MKDGKNTNQAGTQWLKNGSLHREDGPAVVWRNGNKEWYLEGQRLSEEEFNQWRMKQDLNAKLTSNLAPKPITKRGKI